MMADLGRRAHKRGWRVGAKRHPVTYVALLLTVITYGNSSFMTAMAFSFSPRHTTSASRCMKTSLLAKKARKPASKSKASAGGGFGGEATAANNNASKLRSVSGTHAGAGSKALRQAALNFDDLRKEHGKEACSDVYIRSPLNSATRYWFAGKVAIDPNHAPSATFENACISQRRLILEYAKSELRPQNLGGKYAPHLELWLAPGDSEMDVVRNIVTLQPVRGSAADLPDDFEVSMVGFNPEIYVGDERTQGGLRVERNENGEPIKPVYDVNESL